MAQVKIVFDASILKAALKPGRDNVELVLSLAPAGGVGTEVTATPSPRGPLAPLLAAGLLQAGEQLELHQPRARRTARAEVQPDGSLKVDGAPASYSSPSAAACAVTGSPTNGWTAWRTAAGEPLSRLRGRVDAEWAT